nr:5151_t:CDS:2 [Entrophospora candida]
MSQRFYTPRIGMVQTGYYWYCTGYVKNKGKEKNLEHARELLTWIQDAIAIKKLCDPVYGDNGKCNIRAFSKFLKAYAQHLSLLCRIAMRQKIDRFDSGTYYAEGDTSSDFNTNPEPEPKSQPKNNNLLKEVHYNPFDVQLVEIDSMLAKINVKVNYPDSYVVSIAVM